MRDIEEIIKSLKGAIGDSIDATKPLNGYKTRYIDVNISVCPGEPALFETTACNVDELLRLIQAYEDLSNVSSEPEQKQPKETE